MLHLSMKPKLLSIVVFYVTNVTYRLMNEEAEEQRKEFGKLLLILRKDLEIEQGEAARRAGMSRQQWNRLEMGQSGTRFETVARIVEALGLQSGTAEYNAVYMKAGYSPPGPRMTISWAGAAMPDTAKEGTADTDVISVTDVSVMRNDANDSRQVVYEPIDYVAWQAFIKGLPPNVQKREYERIRQLFYENERGQTDYGKRAGED